MTLGRNRIRKGDNLKEKLKREGGNKKKNTLGIYFGFIHGLYVGIIRPPRNGVLLMGWGVPLA